MYYCLSRTCPAWSGSPSLRPLEFHTSLSLGREPARAPRTLVFDLDPGPPGDHRRVLPVRAHAARRVRRKHGLEVLRQDLRLERPAALRAAQLRTPPTTRRSRLKRPCAAVRGAAPGARRAQAAQGAADRARPDRLEPERPYKTTVNVYSLRARDRPTVSTPVSWDEVARVLNAGIRTFSCSTRPVLERVEKQGDLFEPILKLRQQLPEEV